MENKVRLEQIRFKNFKSFSGKHKIGPFLNFTAVIGPNGGGKSNIMDGISFVLGVRSADLRASNLKELIYRKETEKLADLNRDAYVKIIFKTETESFMIFKRTISSSGQSDYFINQQKTSAESYLEVLASFNILTKAKNFLVFQGQVDALAMKSGKELTSLFEKISGSEELKPAYEANKNQVSVCEENLKSVTSKISFLNAERKKLKEQKTHASNYEKGVEKLKGLQGKYYLLQFSSIEFELEKKKKMLQQRDEELEGLRVEKEKVRVMVRECEVSLKNAEQRLANVADDLSSKQGLMISKKPEIVRIGEGIRQMEDRVSSKQDILHQKKSEFSREKQRFEDLKKELKVAEAEIAVQENLIEQEMQTLIQDSKKAEFLRLKKEFGLKTFAELKELDTLQRELESKEIHSSLISQHLKEKKSEIAKVQIEIEDLQTSVQKKITDKEKNEKNRADKIEELGAATAEFKSLKEKEEILLEKIRVLDSKIRDYKVAETSSGEFYKKKTFIDELVRQKKGVRGLLSDLVSPIQPRYAAAMQSGLGPVLNYIVVDTFEVATFVSQKMKDAGFIKDIIILENLPDIHKSESLRQAVSKHGSLLVDILTFNKDYGLEKAMNLFAGSKAFAETLDSASKLRQVKGIKQVITVDGVSIRNGQISSAPIKRRVEKFSQKKESAEKEVEELRNELSKVLQVTRGENRVLGIKEKIEEYSETLKTLSGELEVLNKQLDTKLIKRNEIENLINNLETQNGSKINAIERLKDTIEEKTRSIKRIEHDTFRKFCAEIGVNSIQVLEGKNLDQEKKIQEKISALKKEAAKIVWDLKSINLENLEKNIDALQGSIKKDQEELLKLTGKFEGYSKDNEHIIEASKSLKTQEIQLKEKVSQHKSTSETLRVSFENNSKAVSKAEKEFANEERDFDHLRLQKDQKIEELLLKNLDIAIFKHNQKDIDFSQLDKRYFSMPISEIEKESEELSKAIEKESKNLESLAANAKCIFQVEKLKEIKKKLEEANKSLEQFDRASKEAKSSFIEVKEKRRSQFMQSFDIVANNIGRIYKDMTKSEKNTYYGGNALLYLENTEEPYNGGVIYSPTPPGKRCMYEMDQLSGGEKTIAALSLLFAIHSAMPSPFYIMDEVDAFLDYDNCLLLLNYLTRITEMKSQCVVITHKDEFFSNVDNLIGTTYIPTENTSKSFSLDLRQYGPRQMIII